VSEIHLVADLLTRLHSAAGLFVGCRPVAEPAAAPEETQVEVKAEDTTDVAAQRARDKASEEEGQYQSSVPSPIIQCCLHVVISHSSL